MGLENSKYLDNVAIVLVDPSHIGNIGSAARAVKTMGIYDLRIVTDKEVITPESLSLSKTARDVLENAKVFKSLDDLFNEIDKLENNKLSIESFYPMNLLQKLSLQKEKVEQLSIFQCDSMSEEAMSKFLVALNSITAIEDMLVVKHNNEGDGNATVYIHPTNDKVKLLVTYIYKNKCYVVNLIGDIELLNKPNIVNIGGKDIIKDALTDKEQKQELTLLLRNIQITHDRINNKNSALFYLCLKLLLGMARA